MLGHRSARVRPSAPRLHGTRCAGALDPMARTHCSTTATAW
jgi:hypothetical protein